MVFACFAGITMSFCQSVTILLDRTLLEIFSNLSVLFPVLLSKWSTRFLALCSILVESTGIFMAKSDTLLYALHHRLSVVTATLLHTGST